MQPKCSASTSNSTQPGAAATTTTSSSSSLHTSVDRFKEVCVKHLGASENAQQPREVRNVLEYFFDVHKDLTILKTDLNNLKLYLTAGLSFEAFKTKLKEFDTSSVCGLVWNVNYVAYRCRTCALSPCMSICAECFKNGDHAGHDFNMFRSGAGGACDCGDECVMNPKGFCKSHATDHSNSALKTGPPPELIRCADVILSNLLYSLLQHFRRIYASLTPSQSINAILDEMQPHLDMLNELCAMGTPMRQILVDYMISESFYQTKIREEESVSNTIATNSGGASLTTTAELMNVDQVSEEFHQASKFKLTQPTNYRHAVYQSSLAKQQKIQVPERFEQISMAICESNSRYMVDEFLYWCIRFEFPENLVKFLLSLLPNLSYKQIFIKSFVSQYSFISVLLLNSKSENLSSRVVHISVQLFSNEAIAMKAVNESNLLPIILSTLYNMIVTPYPNQSDRLLIPYNTSDNNKETSSEVSSNQTGPVQLVVNPDHTIMQENLYWLVISDLVNLLSHRAVALKFLQDAALVELWLELVTYFQGMNLNVRTFGDHVQQEPTYFSSFSAELEFCSSVMWSFLQHLKDPDVTRQLSQKVVGLLMRGLRGWLSALGIRSLATNQIKRPNYKQLTFHLPLHRYLSSFIYNSIYQQASSLDTILGYQRGTDSNLLADILAHPLQLQIGFHEIHANMWVRNGMQMKGQAMTYVQNHFCTSFSDADLFLIQLLASRLDADLFMAIFLERFHLFEWLKNVITTRHQVLNVKERKKIEADSIIANVVEEILEEFESHASSSEGSTDRSKLEPSHQIAMLVGALTVLTQIVMIKPNLSFKSYSLTRTECVNLLCVFDRTFSQIEDSMPDVCSLSSAKKFIQPILSEVADFLQPTLDSLYIGSLKQGRYKPKDAIWLHEYDPLYVMLRSVKRREFQESFDRYCQFIEKRQPITSNQKRKSLWPPFRLPVNEQSPCFEYRNHIDKLDLNKEDMELIRQEYGNQLRVDRELQSKSNILNTKSLHAILLTILYEHYYTQPVAEKIFYFLVYILELALHYTVNSTVNSGAAMDTDAPRSSASSPASPKEFDEFDYNTWFKSSLITKNLCTFVPFVFTKYESVATESVPSKSVDLPVSSVDRLNLAESGASEASMEGKVPPLKKMCSGISQTFDSKTKSIQEAQTATDTTSEDETPTVIKTDARTGERYQLKKTRVFESFLSLLVKIYYRNQIELMEKEACSSNINQHVKFPFLNPKSTPAELQSNGAFDRIGDENDFILNLLKKASEACDKCKLNIETSLESLNNLNRRHDTGLDLSVTVPATADIDTSGSKLASPGAGDSSTDELKNKKIKARARQQKLLAQMSSSQKAFLRNPSNKLDVEGYKETTSKASAEGTSESTDEVLASTSLNVGGRMRSQSLLTELETSKGCDGEVSEDESHVLKVEESYDCCICRLSSLSSSDRPIGAVTLLQSTSVLGQRESLSNQDYIKALPLSDEVDYRLIQTDTTCWKQEERRVRNLRECFNLSSCKYSLNIGWKGGVYAQMCGHYLHFDCYNSYKKTLDDTLSRSSNVEYACPLCRQLANCVLPVVTSSLNQPQNKPNTSKPRHSSESSASGADSAMDMSSPPQSQTASLISSTVSNSPAKLWILSSLLNKQRQVEELHISKRSSYAVYNAKADSDTTIEQHILNALRYRAFSTPELSSKVLTQCKNDALAIITLTTPLEFRYIDHSQNFLQSQWNPIDDDIALFTLSVLRTQLEIDLMLRPSDESLSNNIKKRRACFVPLYDVISTHCRLMCHELKPHVKLWTMLACPDATIDDETTVASGDGDKGAKNKDREVPLLLKDPVASLLLILVNLPTNVQKNIFHSVVSTLFNMVFIQSLISLCREFDEEERSNWSNNKPNTSETESSGPTNWNTFQEYTANLLRAFKTSHVLNSQVANRQQNKNTAYLSTIWTLESAKNYVKTKCLHFLKISSLLQYYLYDQEVSLVNMNSFEYLIKHLKIGFNLEDLPAVTLLKWTVSPPTSILSVWIKDLIEASELNQLQTDNLLKLAYDEYHMPQLLSLPYLYSDLFGYYSTKKCQFCSKIPKETGICLLCGVQICYRTHFCCDSMKDFNKKHLNTCGAGTLVILNINSTFVFIVRGKRCAPWASLYLDEHGEEDRDLRRGKPLYLNEQRYNLLQTTWCNHSFDYQSLKWYNISLFNYTN